MSLSTVSIYLNDHLALMTGEMELIRRVIQENKSSELSIFLKRHAGEVEHHRETTKQMLESLKQKQSSTKQMLAWFAEKVGRLKPNDGLTGYTDLARVLELEMLIAMAEQRKLLWRSLGLVGHPELQRELAAGRMNLTALAAETAEQLTRLRSFHEQAAQQLSDAEASGSPG